MLFGRDFFYNGRSANDASMQAGGRSTDTYHPQEQHRAAPHPRIPARMRIAWLYFQLQLGIKLLPTCVSWCCSVPSESMVQICV
jgi:hypothetical protein